MVYRPAVSVADAVDKNLYSPSMSFLWRAFLRCFMDFLNNFKDFFVDFFSASFAFPEYILYISVPFVVGLAVKIFNKIRYGKC